MQTQKIFVAGLVVFLVGCVYTTPANPLITDEFENKIVYKMDADTDAIRVDCAERGGKFDECGSMCAPDADFCAEVCTPVCLLEANEPVDPSPVGAIAPLPTLSGGTNKTDLPLQIAEGFAIEEWATGVEGARVIAGPDALGNFWLSQTREGKISNISVNSDGSVGQIQTVFSGLNNPHGLAINPTDGLELFIAETDKVSKVQLYTEDTLHKIADLPNGGAGHITRTLLFGPDGKLYISIGSDCNVCEEEDERNAAVFRMNTDGSEFEKFANGLRNSVFMTIEPIFGEIWATENGRDQLGDDTPPDEINILADGKNYGWPFCFGPQIRDESFGAVAENYCAATEPAKINVQAHSAPLGLAFIPEEGWSEKYRLDLLVAYHGSWNRSVPTGTKIVRFDLDDERNLIDRQNFVSGWLTDSGEKLGRPVGILLQPGGIGYITDDQRGVIYRLTVESPNSENDLIRIDSPTENAMISSPLEISGEARGPWFFEANFSIKLLDVAGNAIATTIATADGDWMTEEFVPFSATLEFEKPATATGELIFEKANPSGLPENADSFVVPVDF